MQVRPRPRVTLAGGIEVDLSRLPEPLKLDSATGLLVNRCMTVTRLCIDRFAEAPRAVKTPVGGEIVALFPAGKAHTWGKTTKVNDMYAVRSADGGRTWTKPVLAWQSSYNQHAWNPLIPRGGKRIVSFAMEGAFDELDLPHSGPLGMRWSGDDGRTWAGPVRIRPVNDPNYKGVCHMQMCRTPSGAWLLGTYEIRAKKVGRADRQFVLRSADQGKTWLLIGKGGAEAAAKGKPEGWYLPKYDRMLEGLVLSLGASDAVMFTRTSDGHIWQLRSADDGLSWSDPKPTTLVHPDAPPMIYPLRLRDDGGAAELIAFIHNRPASHAFRNAGFADRQDLWSCRSTDGGRTWTQPRFALADAAASPNRWTEVSYCDLLVDADDLHLFCDHQKRQIIHVRFTMADLDKLPTKAGLGAR